MSNTDEYNGWTNRETWAVALHINNDQGWQESVLEALRERRSQGWTDSEGDGTGDFSETDPLTVREAGEIVRDNVEDVLDPGIFDSDEHATAVVRLRDDIGSLWRVAWDELGAAFLSDLAEDDA